jgi:general secretion pathway protein F
MLETGIVPAANRDAANSALSAQGLFPIDLRLDTPHRATAPGIKVRDLALGLRILANLLEAGLPMARALTAFAALAPRGWTRETLDAITTAVREGKSLSGALAAAPMTFPPLVIGMMHAGEAAGELSTAVRKSAEIMEQAAATRLAIRAALTYPIILAVAAALSIGLLLGVVLPRFAEIVGDLGQTLPRSTEIVLGAGAAIRAAAVPSVIAALALAVAWRQWLALGGERSRATWHGLLLGIPLVGTTRRASATAQMTTSLGALLEGGVPIAQALVHAARAGGDSALSRRLLVARERVVGGERLSTALEDTRSATEGAVQLVRAGEATGRLADMLYHAGRIEREAAEELVKNAVRLIEPLLILVFGAVVALVAAALLQAVYSVRPI